MTYEETTGKHFLRTLSIFAAMLLIVAAFFGVKLLYSMEAASGELLQSTDETMAALAKYAVGNETIKAIYENAENYPEEMLASLSRNTELADFVYGYPITEKCASGGFESAELEQEHPLFLQWDKRWGYAPYGSGVIGMTGCGPCCLSMVVLSMTGNSDATPDAVADYAEDNGYCVPGNGTKWTLMSEGCEDYGLKADELPLWENSIKNALDNGEMIICCVGPGDFTSSGHFIVIYGYDSEGFYINDPNSRSRSEQRWSYDDISDQIRCLWSYSLL